MITRAVFLRVWLVLGLVAVSLEVEAGRKDGTLDIYWIDSEGGGSTLIVTPDDESVLIDTGNPGERDAGRIHKVATETAGLTRIDHLVVTHFHIDHFGGAAELAQLMPVGTVYDNGIPERNPDNNPQDTRFPLMIRPYREMKVESRVVLKPDDSIPLRRGRGRTRLSLRCVAAKQEYTVRVVGNRENPECAGGRTKDKDMSDNANSIVLLLEFGGFRFFDGGDLSWNTEAGLVCPVDRVGRVDVYQVNHHGLDVSNNPMLIRSLGPTVAVMNNGPKKGCMPETFATLKAAPSIQAIYQVHKNVTRPDAGNAEDAHIANHEEKCSAQPIHLSVAPTGQEYTVSVPSTGHRKTFAVRGE